MITMHPGEYFREMYLEGTDETITSLSKKLGISQAALSRFVSGKSELTTRMSLILEEFSGRSAESWQYLQMTWSLQIERAKRNKLRSDEVCFV